MGDKAGKRETIVKQLVEEEGRGRDFIGELGKADMAGLRRATEADEKGDVRSLERALSRTLYLLVKRTRLAGKEGDFWSFPSGIVGGKEGLKDVSCRSGKFSLLIADHRFQAAERILYSSCGPNMNTWFVGSHPVGHYIYKIRNPARSTRSDPSAPAPAASQHPLAGEKTFFMKSRISRGQADPKGNEMGVEDFKWLSKEEVQKEVSPQYWACVKNMLVEQ